MFALLLALGAALPSPEGLYHSLDPHSVSEQLAFYELYPTSREGQMAGERVCQLLGITDPSSSVGLSTLPLAKLADLFAKQRFDLGAKLSAEERRFIEGLARHLPNRKLKGHGCWTEREVLELSAEEVDLSRGLLISLMGEGAREEIASYEAGLDLMALQVLARAPLGSLPQEKIEALNHLIFKQLGLRFPPHSLYAKEIDLYTFLPAILDSHRGVCLGVSTLYLCLAQRVGLPLEIITPPGHIYVRYREGERVINIETTARGIHVPTAVYKGATGAELKVRDMKETVGLTFFNQAGALWHNGKAKEAIAAYEKALLYTPDDPLTLELLAYCKWSAGEEREARVVLQRAQKLGIVGRGADRTLAEDLLAGKVDGEGVAAIFQQVDEARESIVAKQERIGKVLARYPEFRAGWFHLAVTYLQLSRHKEAQSALTRCQELCPDDPTVAYYLAVLNFERLNYPNAWAQLKRAEGLAEGELPRPLKSLRLELKRTAPE
ncbi:MAG: transglutaminase family protein [Parachlamydiales bacterium]